MNRHFAAPSLLRPTFARPALALLAALLGWLAPHRAAANSTLPQTPSPAAEAEFQALQARAEDARQDMARWLRETPARDEHLCDKPPNQLSARIQHRQQTVLTAYAAFAARHPQHALASAQATAFRASINADLEIIRRWEEARAADPDSPAPWTQLADELLHCGRTADALDCFDKARAVAPFDAECCFDSATALLLYRRDAMSHYKLAEPEVFERVLTLYRRGLLLEPENYQFAAHYAETFYVLKPARPAEGRAAWEHALSLASDDAQRDEARIHLARHAIQATHLNLARVYLELVAEPRLEPVKQALLRRIHDAAKPGQLSSPSAEQ